jgi:hypothetical protein
MPATELSQPTTQQIVSSFLPSFFNCFEYLPSYNSQSMLNIRPPSNTDDPTNLLLSIDYHLLSFSCQEDQPEHLSQTINSVRVHVSIVMMGLPGYRLSMFTDMLCFSGNAALKTLMPVIK